MPSKPNKTKIRSHQIKELDLKEFMPCKDPKNPRVRTKKKKTKNKKKSLICCRTNGGGEVSRQKEEAERKDEFSGSWEAEEVGRDKEAEREKEDYGILVVFILDI